MTLQAIQWENGQVKIIEQTLLPEKLSYRFITDHQELIVAIKRLEVRGAPAIGIAGAYGVVLGVQHLDNQTSRAEFFQKLDQVVAELKQARPTAVNLFWALEQMQLAAHVNPLEETEQIQARLLNTALQIHAADRQACEQIGKHGAELIRSGMTILTHCNAGALATGGIGTALGVIYTAVNAGKKVRVFADETRPLWQGARLTAWELSQAGIDVTLICDNMAAFLMQQQKIDLILVGADRIAQNGDTANKIGTYNLAVLAREHEIPIYVAAPWSTFDARLPDGKAIPIEERSGDEITVCFGKQIAPAQVRTYNPAFDITPGGLIHGFITERGIIHPPFKADF
ncbi:S-methyl-5-thioribose-1-phosphate isomerase [candidate division KSB1 bacterium]|nr:S-methyl-5-thioribose-1-phosphate isomerase [candidate division KSB1 bacterium]